MTIDHILYVGPDLDELARELARASGVVATVGGKHPGQGTHNALVDIGDARYLELMAPDPEQVAHGDHPTPHVGGTAASEPVTASQDVVEGVTPPFTFYRSIAYAATPQLFTWCARVSDERTFAARARALGLTVSSYPGSRLTPAGAVLRWDLIVVEGHGLGGTVPFFIDWHDSPHPARSVRDVRTGPSLRLRALVLRHPDTEALRSLLAALSDAGEARDVGDGAAGTASSVGDHAPEIVFEESDTPGLVAQFVGANGPFELHGPGSELRPNGV